MYFKELEDDIKSEVHGDFRKALISLLKSPGEIMAMGCHEAMAGAGTNETLLAEIIGSATNEEIKDMKEAYSTLYGKDLIEEVRSECKGNFEHTLVAMLQAARIEPSESDMKAFQKSGVSALVDMAKAEEIAQKLYDAGEGKWGTDESTFVAILCRQSVWMIAAVDSCYKKKFDKSIIEAIKSEFSGDDKDVMLAIARSCLDRSGLYAKMLHEALDGAGTNEAKLIRIVCSRAEIDLGTIKRVYEETYGEPLKKAIMSDLSGDFEKVMVAILGE